MVLVPVSRHHHCMVLSSGHRALRKGRFDEQGRVYLVTFGCAERKPVFRDSGLAAAACRSFSPSARAAAVDLICWVLMPDHFHAVLQLDEGARLSRCVQRIKGCATWYCRQACAEPVSIWARAFHDHAIRRQQDILPAARYVIGNPVRAGLVADIMDYPYWNANWL